MPKTRISPTVQITAELVNSNLVEAVSQAAVAATVRAHVKSAVEAALLEITDHQIRQIWIHGLDKNAKEAAKAKNKWLMLPQLIRHMDQYA